MQRELILSHMLRAKKSVLLLVLNRVPEKTKPVNYHHPEELSHE